MPSRAPAFLLLAAAAAADNSVCFVDCCDSACIEQDRKFTFPKTTSADHSFKFSTSGTITKEVTKATFNITMDFMGTAVHIAPSTGSACDGNVDFKIEGGSLGTMNIDFSGGGKVKCPMKAGSKISSTGESHSNSDPPMGTFVTTTKAYDQNGAVISCQITHVGGCKNVPPPGPAPAPAPGTKLYGCTNNQCVEQATGVELGVCQAVCHNAPAVLPLLGAAQADPCNDALVKTCATEADISVSACKACVVKHIADLNTAGCTAETETAFCALAPGPAPKPPAPDTYTCDKTAQNCVASPKGDSIAVCMATCGGVDPYDKGCQAKTDCQSCLNTQVPGPVPLPGVKQNCGWCFKTNECHDSQTLSHGHCALGCTAKRFPVFDGPQCPAATCNPQKYVCKNGACAKTSTGGNLLEFCEAECAIAPPAPASQYQCTSGSCVESPTGISLDTCRSLCNAPGPAPPAPPAGDMYQCASGKCSESPTGIPLATCQQLCH